MMKKLKAIMKVTLILYLVLLILTVMFQMVEDGEQEAERKR